jgi:hypothetical protein
MACRGHWRPAVSVFPLLIVLLLMALLAELVVAGPRAVRSVMRGEGFRVPPASARLLLLLVAVQIVLVVAWAVLLRGRPL